jgi:hypothetical protein
VEKPHDFSEGIIIEVSQILRRLQELRGAFLKKCGSFASELSVSHAQSPLCTQCVSNWGAIAIQSAWSTFLGEFPNKAAKRPFCFAILIGNDVTNSQIGEKS